jgi:hypothetical protein
MTTSTTSTESMTVQAARELCYELVRTLLTDRGRQTIKARVETTEEVAAVFENGRYVQRRVESGRIIFEGGLTGSHALELSVSSEARVRTHFEGYCENNGCFKPSVGQKVDFPSGSARSGWRTGRVVKVGTKRAVVAFTYKHGGESTATVSFDKLRMYVRKMGPVS